MSNEVNISDRLLSLREKNGWSQTELAARLGVSRNYVSMLEGGREPSKGLIQLLSILEEKFDTTRLREQPAQYKSLHSTAPGPYNNISVEELIRELGDLLKRYEAASRRVEALSILGMMKLIIDELMLRPYPPEKRK